MIEIETMEDLAGALLDRIEELADQEGRSLEAAPILHAIFEPVGGGRRHSVHVKDGRGREPRAQLAAALERRDGSLPINATELVGFTRCDCEADR
jgi:hypothetical protein